MAEPQSKGSGHDIVAAPSRAGPNWPSAIIAGASQTGVRGVRSLLRHGVSAICFDCDSAQAGFRSAYGTARLCPDPDSDPDGWLLFMLELAGTRSGKAVLIPSSDRFVSAIANCASILAERYVLSPGISIQGMLADKCSQYGLAAAHGVPMPRTRQARNIAEVLEFAREASFPCLIKPMHYREWQRFAARHPLLGAKVALATDPQVLVENYRLASQANPCVILQEIIQGPDTAKRVYLSCYDASSKRIAHAMFRELRCDPVGFGPASVSEPADDPETDAICDAFLRSIGYAGICEIEMKWDSRDGRVKLIEANPRLSGGGDAAPHVGVDLCWLHYLDLIGLTVCPVMPRASNFRHVVMRADAAAVPAYLSAGLISWRDVLSSYRPPLAFYDLDRHDWRLSTETLLLSARTFLFSVGRHIFRRALRTPYTVGDVRNGGAKHDD